MPQTYEGAREWETLKYVASPFPPAPLPYCPSPVTPAPHGLMPHLRLTSELHPPRYQHSIPAPSTVLNDPSIPVPRDTVATCPDTALTAFAQLATLRFNTKRALISLFDRDHQYVIAEATQTIPLCPNTQYPQGQNYLWLCGTAVPRSYGICDYVLVGAPGAPGGLDTPDSFVRPPRGDLHVSVIPDLAEYTRFADRRLLRDAPDCRFYVGVPIRSPKGFNIGVLSLFDDTPRPDGLDAAALQLVVDLSQTIMRYLDSRRVNDSYLRSERMVLGLGNFLQGKDEPSTWWSKKEKRQHAHSNVHSSPSHTVSVTKDGVRVHQIDRDRDLSRIPFWPATPPTPTTTTPTTTIATPASPANPAAATTTTTTLPPARDAPLASQQKTESNEPVDAIGRSPTPPRDPHQAQVVNILTTAADIIRVCLDVEGTIFLDASVGSFGRLVDSAHPMSHVDSLDDITSSSEDSSSSQSRNRQDAQPCKVLAVSQWDKSTAPADKPDKDSVMMTESFLAKLLRRYPNGRIFSFDAAGAWYSGESSSSDDATESDDKGENAEPKPSRVRRSPHSRRNEARIIGNLFPGARSVALFPLWDPARDKWHAGGFIWSKTPARILTTDADLPYLRAFGMITMAEINKLDAMIADKAKTDILGSLSHELRSPLHGVVAAAELLHDTQLDVFQMDVVHTIEISGKTLLDTIDHVSRRPSGPFPFPSHTVHH